MHCDLPMFVLLFSYLLKLDGKMCSFVVAMAELSLRKADVEEKRAKVQKESKVLLEYTRKAIAKLNDLKK